MILNVGHVFLLQENTGEETYLEKYAKLFTSPDTLDGTEEYADFTWEDDATAGADVLLEDSDWSTAWSTDHARAENITKQLTYTAAASHSVKGVAILNNAKDLVIGATLRPSPVTPGIGDKIEFLPVIDSYDH